MIKKDAKLIISPFTLFRPAMAQPILAGGVI